ncbi:FAD-dependent oxidoreductase [Terasakiella sp. A23]|uniref:NAD(P)/FAD-dependent oxidoreductase n=1 Tax=Terasakiella sp. FCG-A23 TaxID=3080561 RepID=UPI002952E722|nr:FAD-dependent oxidoreductase [Terasakiella sp. A23]MDV7340881.1 FAD-dependent oxidoreductase [Terasakiella sp. A23]
MKHVILGAGPCGVSAAQTLRKNDPDCEIVLVGDEPELPYSRMAIPYLLVGNIEESGTHIKRSDSFYEENRITLRQNRAEKVDTAAKQVTLCNGDVESYDKLLVATGSRPVKPPIAGLDQPGVHHCWTLEDARKIIELAHKGAHVVLLGAGFIGCIILEALALRNVKLTVVEMGDRMVPRMLDANAGNMLKDWCQYKGVSVHTGTKITQIEPNAGVDEDTLLVDLDNGHQIPAHLVVVAAGVAPNVDFLEDTGVKQKDGILINRNMMTTQTDVYGAGDVAQGLDFSTGGMSVHAIQPTATEHGRIAALNMAGIPTSYQGSLVMNVLDTLGLISVSFGLWDGVEGGDQSVLLDKANYKYVRLEFDGNYLVGAQMIGRTDHVGVLRGLIQSRIDLGDWKAKLMKDPTRVMDAYLACTQNT